MIEVKDATYSHYLGSIPGSVMMLDYDDAGDTPAPNIHLIVPVNDKVCLGCKRLF